MFALIDGMLELIDCIFELIDGTIEFPGWMFEFTDVFLSSLVGCLS